MDSIFKPTQISIKNQRMDNIFKPTEINIKIKEWLIFFYISLNQLRLILKTIE